MLPFGAIPPMAYDGSLAYRVMLSGRFGVEIFFVISGFILALSFLEARLAEPQRRVSTARFYVRRLTRLEPPYLAALLLWAVVGAALIAAPEGGSLSHVAAGSFYLHHLVFGTAEPVLAVAWSLEIEIRFYLLVPLLAWALCFIRSTPMRRLSVVLLAASALLIASFTAADILGGLWYAPFFLAGWLVADVSVTGPRAPARNVAWDLVALVALVLSVGLFLEGNELFVILGAPMTLGLLLLGILRGRWVRAVLSRPILIVIGGMAYSIYLVHYPVLVIWGRWAESHRWAANPVGVTVAVIAALTISGVFFVLIERPCMNPTWPKRVASVFSYRSRPRDRGVAPAPIPVTSEPLP